jgi:hypothetical protein
LRVILSRYNISGKYQTHILPFLIAFGFSVTEAVAPINDTTYLVYSGGPLIPALQLAVVEFLDNDEIIVRNLQFSDEDEDQNFTNLPNNLTGYCLGNYFQNIVSLETNMTNSNTLNLIEAVSNLGPIAPPNLNIKQNSELVYFLQNNTLYSVNLNDGKLNSIPYTLPVQSFDITDLFVTEAIKSVTEFTLRVKSYPQTRDGSVYRYTTEQFEQTFTIDLTRKLDFKFISTPGDPVLPGGFEIYRIVVDAKIEYSEKVVKTLNKDTSQWNKGKPKIGKQSIEFLDTDPTDFGPDPFAYGDENKHQDGSEILDRIVYNRFTHARNSTL